MQSAPPPLYLPPPVDSSFTATKPVVSWPKLYQEDTSSDEALSIALKRRQARLDKARLNKAKISDLKFQQWKLCKVRQVQNRDEPIQIERALASLKLETSPK